MFTEQTSDDYEPLRTLWENVGLDANYLNDSVPLKIEKILAKIKAHYDTDVFFSTDISDDPRNSSSYALLFIGENEESNKIKKK